MFTRILGYEITELEKELLVELSFNPTRQYDLGVTKTMRAHDLRKYGLLEYTKEGLWRTNRNGELVVEEILREREWQKGQ